MYTEGTNYFPLQYIFLFCSDQCTLLPWRTRSSKVLKYVLLNFWTFAIPLLCYYFTLRTTPPLFVTLLLCHLPKLQLVWRQLGLTELHYHATKDFQEAVQIQQQRQRRYRLKCQERSNLLVITVAGEEQKKSPTTTDYNVEVSLSFYNPMRDSSISKQERQGWYQTWDCSNRASPPKIQRNQWTSWAWATQSCRHTLLSPHFLLCRGFLSPHEGNMQL